jgi:acylphosphatase
MKRLIAHVSGKIKGVGYSSMVVTLAGTLDLKGFIEFLPDGKAFIIAEGPEEDLARFIRAIRIDNAKIKVKEILTDYREPTDEFNNFKKIVHSQEEQIHPGKDASETMTFNFLQAPDQMERLDREICAPNHKWKREGPDLERMDESTKLCKEETRVPESCKSLPKNIKESYP